MKGNSFHSLWLLFAQCVTIFFAAFFVISTLRPGWIPDQWRALLDKKDVVVIKQDAASTSLPVPPDYYNRSKLFAPAIARAMPAVVSLYSRQHSTNQPARSDDDVSGLSRYFSLGARKTSFDGRLALGSGIIVSQRGYIVTNYHVVEGMDDIHVFLSDGRSFPATIRGFDRVTDLAVIEIKNIGDKELPVITLGSMDNVRVGDVVFAIGNPFGLSNSVSMGIVSALGRGIQSADRFENFIQTDASINPGNSGGALIDLSGNMIGINRAIYSQSGGSLGIGFATPVPLARNVMKQIIEYGEVVRGWLGIEVRTLVPGMELVSATPKAIEEGVIVTNLLPHGPAQEAGVEVGDVITEINSVRVNNFSQIFAYIDEQELDTPIRLHVWRKGDWIDIDLTVQKRDNDSDASKFFQSAAKLII